MSIKAINLYCFFYFLIILTYNSLTYAQNQFDYVPNELRGYNDWEMTQSQVYDEVTINPLGNNGFIKNMKIKTATQYSKYFEDKVRKKEYQHEYDSLGNLILTKSMFYFSSSGSRSHSVEHRYNYNDSTGHFSSIEYKASAIVDRSSQDVNCWGCSFTERKMNYWSEERLLESIEFYCDYDNKAKCIIKYRYFNNDLIKKIVYTHSGTIEYEISFEYEFYK